MKALLALLVCAGVLQSAETFPFVPSPFDAKLETLQLSLRELGKRRCEATPGAFHSKPDLEKLRFRRGDRPTGEIRIFMPRPGLDPKMVHSPGKPGVDYKLRIIPVGGR